MREEMAELVRDGLKEAGIDTIITLPDSRLKELYPLLAADSELRYIPVTNEGEGVAIAAGFWLGGKNPVMLMENSGFRVACEPLARLGLTHGIPVLMILSDVGVIGEGNWWGIAHGITMEPLLKAMRVPYIIVKHKNEVKDAIKRAKLHISTSLYHVAIILTGEITKKE